METNRRNFVKVSSLALGGLWLAQHGMSAAAAANKAAPTALRVRRNVSTLSVTDPASDLAAYKLAVETMKKRKDSDPTSWHYQATIHNDFCPHRNWFFLPWHRAYLKYFEDICREAYREATKNPQAEFSLPYWNWTEQREIPAPFWDKTSSLYDANRVATSQSKASSEFVGPNRIAQIMALSSYEDFASYKSDKLRGGTGGKTGELEGGPHNYIHGFVGGDMGTFMSPLDPIFWLHHANVDRIWAMWNDANHANSTDSSYVGFNLNTFYDTSGKPTGMTVGNTYDHRAANLNYIYDTEDAKPLLAVRIGSTFRLQTGIMVSAVNRTPIRKLTPASFKLAGSGEQKLKASMKDFMKTTQLVQGPNKQTKSLPDSQQEFKLIISDIQPPSVEDFFVRAFINADRVTVDTPLDDPHYVGSFAFFASTHGHEMSGDHMGAGHMMAAPAQLTFVLDATDTLARLAKTANPATAADNVQVQLLTVPLKAGSVGEFLPGKIELVTAVKEG